ncbi:Calcipressin domain containing protein [Amanita muscaria]
MPGLVISLPSSPLSSVPASPTHRTPLSHTPPSHTRSSSINLPRRTNTLAIAQLPRTFFIPEILNIIQSHFNFFGVINQWVPLPGFGRIIIVYENEDHAEEAKTVCDPIILQGEESDKGPQMVLRVYRADPNPLIPKNPAFGDGYFSMIPQENYLQPPPIEKNFLISPPGSPPVGWEQIKEDPPNQTPLAEDLMAALRRLQLEERRMSGFSSLEVLLHPEESGVGVYVEDCDMAIDGDIPSEDNWIYGETAPARSRWMGPTAMPPINPHPIAV